jgi:very-short-patch-repair endonuclease
MTTTIEPPIRLPDTPFTLADLETLDLDRPTLRRLIRAGFVRVPFYGAYVPAHLPDTQETRAAALGMAVTEHHVICGRTAAWLHGVETYSRAELQVAPEVETCALRGRTPTRLKGADGRTRDLTPHEVMTIGTVRVTTPLRTALDLGCHLKRREAMAALNEFARRHGVTALMLARELPRFAGRRGVVQLRELVPLVDPRIESQRESWVWLALGDHNLPMPEPQYWIEIDGVPTYRLDFAWVLARVCVEYDGVDGHDLTEDQRRSDAARRAWLREHGWTVIVVRLGDFTGEALDRWIRELREALRPTYSTLRF